MGWVFLTADCIACGRTFTCSPSKVPSVRVEGKREPVCRPCVESANRIRKENGMELFTILPGAYEAEECS